MLQSESFDYTVKPTSQAFSSLKWSILRGVGIRLESRVIVKPTTEYELSYEYVFAVRTNASVSIRLPVTAEAGLSAH